jgi:hypothetical protein
MRAILDLCSGTGSWSKPYRDAGYVVIQWDLPNDVRLMPKPDVPIHGILAGPPCTKFTSSGNRWKRTDAEMLEAIGIVDACLRFVALCRPSFWVLENPVGKLHRWLGPPQFIFDPCDYGDPYTKKTCLWGDFVRPEYRYVKPTEGSKMWKKYGGKSARTKRERSKTPEGFAQAFFEANP